MWGSLWEPVCRPSVAVGVLLSGETHIRSRFNPSPSSPLQRRLSLRPDTRERLKSELEKVKRVCFCGVPVNQRSILERPIRAGQLFRRSRARMKGPDAPRKHPPLVRAGVSSLCSRTRAALESAVPRRTVHFGLCQRARLCQT